MDEQRLQIPFEVMKSPAEERRGDDGSARSSSGADAVNQRRSDVEERENEERTRVFGQEDGDPADLRTEVFEVELFDAAEGIECGVILEELPLGVGLESDAFEGLLRRRLEPASDVFDRGVGGDVVQNR